MTEQEITELKSAIETVGLTFTKYPKKIEIKIPKVKYPGVYFQIPTDLKSFKLQVFFHQTSISYFEKIKTKGFNTAGEDLSRTIFLNEVKGIPCEAEIEGFLTQALETVKKLGIAHAPELN